MRHDSSVFLTRVPSVEPKKCRIPGLLPALCRAGECIIWTIFPPRALVSQVRCSSSQQQRGTLQLMSFIVTGVPSWC